MELNAYAPRLTSFITSYVMICLNKSKYKLILVPALCLNQHQSPSQIPSTQHSTYVVPDRNWSATVHQNFIWIALQFVHSGRFYSNRSTHLVCFYTQNCVLRHLIQVKNLILDCYQRKKPASTLYLCFCNIQFIRASTTSYSLSVHTFIGDLPTFVDKCVLLVHFLLSKSLKKHDRRRSSLEIYCFEYILLFWMRVAKILVRIS